MLNKKPFFSCKNFSISRKIQVSSLFENDFNSKTEFFYKRIYKISSEDIINLESIFKFIKKNTTYLFLDTIPKNIDNFILLKGIDVFKMLTTIFTYFFVLELADNYTSFFSQFQQTNKYVTLWTSKAKLSYSDRARDTIRLLTDRLIPKYFGYIDIGFYLLFDIYRFVINITDPRSNNYYQ